MYESSSAFISSIRPYTKREKNWRLKIWIYSLENVLTDANESDSDEDLFFII